MISKTNLNKEVDKIFLAFSKLKLWIELLPRDTWNKNLRTMLPSFAWQELREDTLVLAKGRCSICKQKSNTLDAHEVWGINDLNNTQGLLNIIAVCKDCHNVIHFGHTVATSANSRCEEIKNHFTNVNKCSEKIFDVHLYYTMALWEDRNNYKWKIDWGKYTELVNNYKETGESNNA